MLTVEDLVQADHLGLTVLAGRDGLGNAVVWAHGSEIEDTADWLDGGEILMMTGLGFPASAASQVAFVRRLAEVRVAALAVGHRMPLLSAEMLAEADRLGLPVLRVALDVPFLAIDRLVAAANGDTAMSRMATQVLIYDSLRSRVDSDRSVADLFRHLEGVAGYSLFVVSEQGRSLLPGLPDAPDDVVPRLPDVSHSSPALPSGMAVPVPLAGRTAAYLVALEREGKAGVGLTAIRHIATITALELALLYRDRDTTLQRNSEALADLLGGRFGRAEAERALIGAGLTPGEPLVLAAVKSRKLRRPGRQEIYHRLCDAGTPAMLLGRPDVLFVLLHDTDHVLEGTLAGDEFYAGLSEPFDDPLAVTVARMQAMWAVLWRPVTMASPVLRFEESSGWMTWLPHELDTLRKIVDHNLAPLVEYDAANSTELVHTLRVFLRLERNIGRTAEELFIHKHTLQYRLRRIKEIAGRSMSSTKDLAELWFTFQAESLLEGAELDEAVGPFGVRPA